MGCKVQLSNALDNAFSAEADPTQHNNRAKYYLAKMAYQRGDDDSALAHLATINGQMPVELEGRDRYINALINMRKQQVPGSHRRVTGLAWG